MPRQHRQRSRIFSQCGLTLVELAVVVLISRIIGSFAAPRMSSWTDDAQIETAVASIQAVQYAAQYFHAENVYWYDDVNSGSDVTRVGTVPSLELL